MTGDDYNTITDTCPQQKPYQFIYMYMYIYNYLYTHDLGVYQYWSPQWLAKSTNVYVHTPTCKTYLTLYTTLTYMIMNIYMYIVYVQ